MFYLDYNNKNYWKEGSEENNTNVLGSNFFIWCIYLCKINDKNIIISTADKKIFIDEGYGKRTGYLQGEEYVFGRGTGSIKIIRNNHGEIIKIIRDDNVETRISTSCYKFNKD